MPLSVLLPMVVLGIAGLGLLLHLAGQSRAFEIGNDEVARREWLRHWPDDAVFAVHLVAGAALVETQAGLGLLRAFGTDTVAHRVTGMREIPGGLRIEFGDFGVPAVRLAVEDPGRWLQIWRAAHA